MKHSFGTIIPRHQSHGTPRGQCRPMLEAQGKGGVRARSQTLFLGTQASLSSWSSTQALPEISTCLNFNMSRDQPEYGIPQALCFLTPSVLGLGWALTEGIRGCSLTWGLEGDFGAAPRPGRNNRKSDRKRDRGLCSWCWCLPEVLTDPTLEVWCCIHKGARTAGNKPCVVFIRSSPHSVRNMLCSRQNTGN